MPTIAQLSEPVSVFPSVYISPFGNDGVIPLYSSIPLNNNTSGQCLPCVVCGNSKTRAEVISEEAQSNGFSNKSSIKIANY